MKRILFWAMLTVWIVMTACTDQTQTDKINVSGDGTVVRLSLDAGTMVTKASVATEATINEVTILVFEESGGNYTYNYQVQPTHESGNDYKATLTSTSSGVKLFILANASPLPALSQGDPETDLISSAIITNTAAGPEYLPMYGEIGFTHLPEDSSVSGKVSLLRAVASVQVDAQKVEDEFILKSIQGYRSNPKIQVIPDAWSLNEDGDKVVTAPSVPSGGTPFLTDAVNNTGGSTLSGLYLPEAIAYSDPAARITEPTCLIIGGVYLKDNPSNTVTYYRIDFKNSTGEDFGQILRNHKYMISITGISAPGEATPEAAGEKEAQNMDNNIIIRDDDDDSEIHGPDGSHISLQTNVIRVNYFEGAQQSVSVDCNPDNYTIQWVDNDLNPVNSIAIPGGGPVNGSLFSIEISDDSKMITATALSANTTHIERREQAIVTLGSIQILLTVTQKISDDYVDDYITIFNYTGLSGSLGDDLFGTTITPGTTSQLLSGILKNTGNFGPNGTLPFGGFVFAGLTSQTKMTYELADIFDIILIPAGMGDNLSGEDIDILKEWSTQKTGRFIFTYLDNSVLTNKLDLKVSSVTAGGDWSYTMQKAPEAPDYIFKGPFGNLSSLSLRMSAIYYDPRVILRSETNNPDIIPLMVNSSNPNEMVVALDTRYHIIYWGDYSPFVGTDTYANFSMNGDDSKDGNKLLLNLFAWMVEVYFGEKLAPVIP